MQGLYGDSIFRRIQQSTVTAEGSASTESITTDFVEAVGDEGLPAVRTVGAGQVEVAPHRIDVDRIDREDEDGATEPNGTNPIEVVQTVGAQESQIVPH